MGTRSITSFINEEGSEICTLYRQFDGYPSGHGQDLFDALRNAKLVNGLRMSGHEVNGMSDLAVQVISYLKVSNSSDPLEGGGLYLHPPGTNGLGESYTYVIYSSDGDIYLDVFQEYNNIYRGKIKDFDPEMD